MRRLLAVGLVVVLLGAAVLVPGTATSSATQSPPQTVVASQEFDGVEFHITVFEDGSARWTFRYQRVLNNETQRQQFEKFARTFNQNQTALYDDFKRQATDLAAAGKNGTGRPMKAKNFTREAYIGGLNDNVGVVEMSFVWTWFADAKDGHLVVGDVFEGGLYLGPNQSMVIEAGDGLRFQAARPADGRTLSGDTLSDSDTVTWQGKYEFTDQRPKVRFAPTQTPQTTTLETTAPAGGPGPGANTTQPTTHPPPSDGNMPMMLLVTAIVIVLGVAAAFAWRQGGFDALSTDGGGSDSGSGSAAVATRPNGATTEPAVSEEELLTDEARVMKLLDENGGRMKQVNIVEETGWSKSKVSMLLSEMEDEGDISKLRVGRENIISLEGHEPDAAGSPLDE